MIKNSLLFLLICLKGSGFWLDLSHHVKGINLQTRYSSKIPLRIYAKETESLRAPEITTLININTADVDQLKQLPSIGSKRAAAIIKYREALPLRQFESIEQLLEVPEIHAKSFERIRAYIII